MKRLALLAVVPGLAITAPRLAAQDLRAKELPFTAEEDADGSRFVWFIFAKNDFRYEYLPANELPNSPAFRKLRPNEKPMAADLACWPSFVWIYDPSGGPEKDLGAHGKSESLKVLQTRLGAPTWLRYEDGWLEPFKTQHRTKGLFAFAGDAVSFVNPDMAVWQETQRVVDEKSRKANLMLTRRAIRDMDGRDIKPVISLVLERLLNPPATAKAYCEDWRERQDARSELIRSEDKGESVISYRSYESAGVKHRVVIEYLVRGDVGLQAICDSTESVYDSVSDDFTSWVESVRIDPQ